MSHPSQEMQRGPSGIECSHSDQEEWELIQLRIAKTVSKGNRVVHITSSVPLSIGDLVDLADSSRIGSMTVSEGGSRPKFMPRGALSPSQLEELGRQARVFYSRPHATPEGTAYLCFADILDDGCLMTEDEWNELYAEDCSR